MPRSWKDFLYFNAYLCFDLFLLDVVNLKERKMPWQGLSSPANPKGHRFRSKLAVMILRTFFSFIYEEDFNLFHFFLDYVYKFLS